MENPPLPEAQPPPEKRGRFWIVAGAVLGVMVVAALGVYAWYAVYGPCTRGNVNTASTALFEQVATFEQAYQAAASANAVGLMGPLTSMQQALWDTREVVVPACMQVARNELIASMESAIRAFLAVMNGEKDETVRDLLQDSKVHLENFATEMESVNQCAPFCPLNAAGSSPLALSSARAARSLPAESHYGRVNGAASLSPGVRLFMSDLREQQAA